MYDETNQTPVAVPPPAPIRQIDPIQLKMLGEHLSRIFEQYRSDRKIAELKWLKNLRQYLGIYDPEIEKELGRNRSRAYPRITRVKCISVLSRIMNLMFPGNERNWEVKASPSPDMSPQDIMAAVQEMIQKDAEAGLPGQVTPEKVKYAVERLAQQRAKELCEEIDDQLQEIGGDQTLDYIALNRKVAQSGIVYGLGVLRGPFVRAEQGTQWGLDPVSGMPAPMPVTRYKPQFEFLPVWDFYPDMSAKSLYQGDGYFVRMVMTRSQLRKLADRPDFFGTEIKKYLQRQTQGNYRPQEFETELRSMGIASNVNVQKAETSKYEVIVWNGPISGEMMVLAGVDIPEDMRSDDVEAEIWMIDGCVIKADINPWRQLGVEMRTIHPFLFDEDDTSPVGNGLPNVMRDSQMSIAASARMLLDNASVVCGPSLEANTELLRADQDLTSIQAYKIWYREGTGADAAQPAIRNISVDAHLDELLKTIELFMGFADQETFVGPATGGDMERKGASEPMRTAVGASMLRSDAALPFKDIVRNFDTFTQSVIQSLVTFNKKFNPERAPEGDYNVIARGATSLIAKEVRAMQMDQLAQTMAPEDRAHIDERKFIEARFMARDLQDLLLPPDEVKRREEAGAQRAREMEEQQRELIAAEIRKTLSDAFKNIAQGQKNAANADAASLKAAMDVLTLGMGETEDGEQEGTGADAPRPSSRPSDNR